MRRLPMSDLNQFCVVFAQVARVARSWSRGIARGIGGIIVSAVINFVGGRSTSALAAVPHGSGEYRTKTPRPRRVH